MFENWPCEEGWNVYIYNNCIEQRVLAHADQYGRVLKSAPKFLIYKRVKVRGTLSSFVSSNSTHVLCLELPMCYW